MTRYRLALAATAAAATLLTAPTTATAASSCVSEREAYSWTAGTTRHQLQHDWDVTGHRATAADTAPLAVYGVTIPTSQHLVTYPGCGRVDYVMVAYRRSNDRSRQVLVSYPAGVTP